MTAYVFDRRDPKRLLICSDTLGYSPHRPPKPLGHVDKIIPIPRLRGALLGRGATAIQVSAAAHLMMGVDLFSFGDVVEALPWILSAVTTQYAAGMDIEDPDSLMLSETLWAGWNDRERRCEIIAFRNFEGYRPVPDDLQLGVSCLPVLPQEYAPPGLAKLPLERILVELMKAMRRYFTEHPEINPALIGGELVLTEISERAVTSRIVHRFEDYEQARHAAAAVRGRIDRGDDAISFDGICRVDEAIETAESAPSGGSGASRAERRRAEKEARRAARRAA